MFKEVQKYYTAHANAHKTEEKMYSIPMAIALYPLSNDKRKDLKHADGRF